MRREDSDQLAHALDALPDDEREVLRLRFFEDFTLKQICEEMSLTKDAATWLMQKAMKRLKPRLPKDNDPVSGGD